MMPELTNCQHSPSGWCLACVGELHSQRDAMKTVADALAALREGYTLRADGEGASIPWRAATDLARQELDATIAKLGLARKENE